MGEQREGERRVTEIDIEREGEREGERDGEREGGGKLERESEGQKLRER